MRVLLDHCVPRRMATMLVGHQVSTTQEMGWQNQTNGKLLLLAAADFGVFLTVDRNLSRQQNLTGLPLPVVVLQSRSNAMHSLARHAPGLLSLLNQDLQCRVYVLGEPPELDGHT